MTLIHYLLLFALSGILSFIAFYYLRFGKISIVLFYVCIAYLTFIISIPFGANVYSFVFNNILNLPDARISILAIFAFGISIVTIYLLSRVSTQDKQLRMLNREIALLRFNLQKLYRAQKSD